MMMMMMMMINKSTCGGNKFNNTNILYHEKSALQNKTQCWTVRKNGSGHFLVHPEYAFNISKTLHFAKKDDDFINLKNIYSMWTLNNLHLQWTQEQQRLLNGFDDVYHC